MGTLDINREIARIRALPGGNFLAIALKTIQDHANQIIPATNGSTPAASGASSRINAGGGGVAPSPAPSPFVLSINGAPLPGTSANLNNTWPPPPAGRLAVLFQVDTMTAPPSVSGSFLNTASSLIAVNVVPFSATPEFDASLGQVQEITMTGNVTSFTIVNGIPGQFLTIIWIQDGTGGWTVSGVPGDVINFTAPGTAANSYSAQTFAFDGTSWVSATPVVPLFSDSITPTPAVDGMTTVFTLPAAPNPPESLMVFLNHDFQIPILDYNLSGTTLTMTVAPGGTDSFLVSYRRNP